ncbi:MAG: AAA family ATPase [Chitinophagales bacterium]
MKKYEDELLNESQEPLFAVKTVNNWMEEAKEKPIPLPLFGTLWHEGELAIMFADTNVGKSILAVQIANLICNHGSLGVLHCKAAIQKVVYCDFEQSSQQFFLRYSNEVSFYHFSPLFLRVEINTAFQDLGAFEEHFESAVEKVIKETGSKVLIIDNISFLRILGTETGKEAIMLMQLLTRLKKAYGLSILILAHTPKRDQSRPLTVNDLGGSKQLANFADSIFAIGESTQDKSIRYIKQMKARVCEKEYEEENVIVCTLEKNEAFVQFCYQGCDKERKHLRVYSDEDQSKLEQEILKDIQGNPSLSHRELARRHNTNHKKVGRIIERAQRDGTLGTEGTTSQVSHPSQQKAL